MAAERFDSLPDFQRKEGGKRNPFSSVLFCSLLLKANGSCVCQGPRARQAARHLGDAESRLSLAGRWLADIPQGSPKAQVTKARLPCSLDTQTSPPGKLHWVMLHTRVGATMSCQQFRQFSPAPFSQALSSLPQPCFKRDRQQANPLSPSYLPVRWN